MTGIYERHLRFKSVSNFRDIGGYRGDLGKRVAWRRIFRSGEFRNVTTEDIKRLTEELSVKTVLDLRSSSELKNNGKGLLEGSPVRYCNIAFMTDDDGDPEANAKKYDQMVNLGDFYVELMSSKEYGGKIIQALEIIGDPANHPLVFHCAVGKDRTGMLAAMLLTLLGVKEADIIEDYTLSAPYMVEVKAKFLADPKVREAAPKIPDIFWGAVAPSMEILLNWLKKEYGSAEQYLKDMGMPAGLPAQLKNILLA